MRSTLTACEFCDSVYRLPTLAAKQMAHCTRCGAVLHRGTALDLEALLALTLAALAAFIVANAYPVVIVDLNGIENESRLWDAIHYTWTVGIAPVAVLAAACSLLFPLAQILLMLWLLVPLLRGRRPRGFIGIMHVLRVMRPWSMVEVFVLGAIVSVAKLTDVMQTAPGTGLWAFAALSVLLTVVNGYDLRRLWDLAPQESAA